MGDWAIVVHGTGAHHNKDYPIDADRMAQEFVDKLIAAGHQVQLATFTSGGRTVLDTVENLGVKWSESVRDSDSQAQVDENIGKRRTALERVGLTPSPRKDPVPGGPPTD
jgi:hypothetical protein